MKWLALICGIVFSALGSAGHAQQGTVVTQRLPVILPSTATGDQFAGREELLTPEVDRGAANVASATRSPWVDANGWLFLRHPDGKFYYDLPPDRAPLALAEAFAYNADAVLDIDPADAEDAARMQDFLKGLSAAILPTIADIGVVDDGSEEVAEVMNLLARRNLLFEVVTEPSARHHITIELGSDEFPIDDAGDPSEFAQQIRRQLGDKNRSLRIYGTETVLAHWTGDGERGRLHLLNYGGRDVYGLRVRLRGKYRGGTAFVFGQGQVELLEVVHDADAFEFSLERVGVYAAVDVQTAPTAQGQSPGVP